MYLRFARRIKNGKEHRNWSIVESKRCAGGKVVQRPVLYLGEINDSQHADWCRVIETLDADNQRYRQLALFPADRSVPEHAKGYGVQVRLEAMQLHRPRQLYTKEAEQKKLARDAMNALRRAEKSRRRSPG